MPTFNRILVPVDFSGCSRTAVGLAAFLGEKFHAAIDLLHVWEPPLAAVPLEPSLPIFAYSQAGLQMENLLALLERRRLGEVRGRLEAGRAADKILEVAGIERYDLIIMGTHGRSGLSHLLQGSVAERVVRRAVCPVMTVHQSDAWQALDDWEDESTWPGAAPNRPIGAETDGRP